MAKWAYAFPFGSVNLGVLDECTDEELQRWPIGRLRDQAVAVDMEAARTEGRLQELERTLGVLEWLLGQAPVAPDLPRAVAHTRDELARSYAMRQWMQGLQ